MRKAVWSWKTSNVRRLGKSYIGWVIKQILHTYFGQQSKLSTIAPPWTNLMNYGHRPVAIVHQVVHRTSGRYVWLLSNKVWNSCIMSHVHVFRHQTKCRITVWQASWCQTETLGMDYSNHKSQPRKILIAYRCWKYWERHTCQTSWHTISYQQCFLFCLKSVKFKDIWASSWDYGTYHRCAGSPEPSLFAYIKNGSRRRVQPKIRHLAPLDGCACAFEEWIYGGRKIP